MVIDFHTHPLIESTQNMNFYGVDLTPDDVLEDMKNAGIDKFCGSVIQLNPKDYTVVWQHNEAARRLPSVYGDACIPGIHVHPADIERSISEIKLAAEEGIRLIGELVPYMHGWEDYSCRAFSEILDAAEQYGMVVSLHTLNLEQMKKMASAHKNITFVFAHPGESKLVNEHIEVMRQCENVYLDTSGTGLFRYGMTRYLVEKVGAERIIFGTDYPICNAKMYVNGILGERITDREKELILGGNAERILKL